MMEYRIGQTYEVHYVYSSYGEIYRRQEKCESERACNGLPQHVNEGASAMCNCA